MKIPTVTLDLMTSAMKVLADPVDWLSRTSCALEIHKVTSVRNENVGPKAGFNLVEAIAELALLGCASVAVFVTWAGIIGSERRCAVGATIQCEVGYRVRIIIHFFTYQNE